MALEWHWNEKVGEAVFDQCSLTDPTKEKIVNLYEGNAFLILVYEHKNAIDEDVYTLAGFFANEIHMNRCLGLEKGYDNIYASNGRLKRISFNKAKSRNYKQIIPALVEAFDDIEIKIYTKEDEEK